MAPALLTFHDAADLRIQIDYATPTAGIMPFSIDGISREARVYPNGFTSYRWTIPVNWPSGSITFAATRFTQVLRRPPWVSDHQCLEPAERG